MLILYIENPNNIFIRYIGDEYVPDLFQVGLDMLYRLNRTDIVVKCLLLKGKVSVSEKMS